MHINISDNFCNIMVDNIANLPNMNTICDNDVGIDWEKHIWDFKQYSWN